MLSNLKKKTNHAVYEIMCEKYGRARQITDANTIRRMRFVCWLTEATNTYPKYVILIAFSRQKYLRERASICTCIACLSAGDIQQIYSNIY